MHRFEDAPPLPRWIEREMPYARRALRVGRTRLCFVDHGPREGTAVLLVHGNPTWSYLWRRVIARLPSGLRAIAPDLAGFGTSDKPLRARDHRLSMHVEHVSALVEALELDQLVAVGQDWGGPIAAGAAARHESRVRGLVFANTAVLPPARPFRPKLFHRAARVPVLSEIAFGAALLPVLLMRRAQGDPASLGPRQIAAYAWPLRGPRDRAGPLGLARMVPHAEAHPSTEPMDRIGEWVRAWRGPAALVWGRSDPILGRGLSRHREALPQASVREHDAGHFLQEEAPELLADAIAEVAASGPRVVPPRGPRGA